MARFPEHFIQHVLQATDVVELVGQYVALKRKGREFVGLCPFHDDSSPSMYVSPTKQIYKCFACGAGGNSIQFVMNYEKLSFPEAVRTLADRNNIPLPRDMEQAPTTEGGLSKSDLAGICEWAMKFFAAQLKSPAGAAAMEYVRGRGMSEASIENFGIGYAPDSWDALLKAAARKGIGETQLVSAGLAKRRDSGSGCYDYFRNRLMFPIHDTAGRVAGFGGRALSAEERAKYLNSPESVLFDKSNMLYGLQFARDAIVHRRQAVVVEGYFDVLMPLQQGVGNVVATLGTALTDRHVRMLSRFADEAVLVFDADVAGAAAAERALELFLAQKLHVRVATIPAGKDPCDYSLAEGGEAMQALIDAAPDALQYVWDQRYAAWQAAGGNPSQRNQLVDDFLQLIVNSGSYGAIDGVRQQTLAQHIAHILNIPAIDLQQQMKSLSRRITRRSGGQSQVATARQAAYGPGAAAEREVLETLLDRPELFDDVMERIVPNDFRDALLRTIAQRVWELGEEGRLSLEELMGGEDMGSLSGILAELAMAGERRGNHEATLAEATATLQGRRDRHEVERIKQEGFDNDDTLRRLQQRLSKGDKRKRPKIQ